MNTRYDGWVPNRYFKLAGALATVVTLLFGGIDAVLSSHGSPLLPSFSFLVFLLCIPLTFVAISFAQDDRECRVLRRKNKPHLWFPPRTSLLEERAQARIRERSGSRSHGRR